MLKTSTKALLALFFIGFAVAILSIVFLDNAVYNLVHNAFYDQRNIWENITHLGDSSWMAALCLLFIGAGLTLSKPKIWRAAALVFASVAIVGTAALIAKRTIGRARPYLFDAEGTHSFMPFQFDNMHAGFPSGHTTTAFAFATALTILYPRAALPAFAIAILAGFSRMAVDAHYLADVIGGATFGIIGTIAVAKWLAPKLIK